MTIQIRQWQSGDKWNQDINKPGYHQEINEKSNDFNGSHKETPVEVYFEVELVQTILSETKTPTKSGSFSLFADEVFYHFTQRAIQTLRLNNHKVKYWKIDKMTVPMSIKSMIQRSLIYQKIYI